MSQHYFINSYLSWWFRRNTVVTIAFIIASFITIVPASANNTTVVKIEESKSGAVDPKTSEFQRVVATRLAESVQKARSAGAFRKRTEQPVDAPIPGEAKLKKDQGGRSKITYVLADR